MSSTNPTQPQTFNPPTVAPPPPTYNQVAITALTPQTKLITLAGQTGIDAQTHSWPANDLVSQARTAHANVAACLAAAGASPRDIVHVRHYIVDRDDPGSEDYVDVVDRGWGRAWVEFMDREADGHRPPDTVVGVAGLAKKVILYECEVWAVVNPSS